MGVSTLKDRNTPTALTHYSPVLLIYTPCNGLTEEIFTEKNLAKYTFGILPKIAFL